MKHSKYIAVCDSEQCAMVRVKIGTQVKNGKVYNRVESKYIGPQVKSVSQYTIDCPDCKSALFWTRDEILLKDRVKVG